MKIAVVNDIHVGLQMEHKGQMRAASHLAERRFPELLMRIVEKHQPDCVVNLGDLIRGESREIDIKRYLQSLSAFQKISCPTIHVIGNHEIRYMSVSDVEQCWKERSFDQISYGTRVILGVRIIWLGMLAKKEDGKKHYLPEDQLHWLRHQLESAKEPILVFIHCAIDDQDARGNFFYEELEKGDSSSFFLENQLEIRAILQKNKLLRGVFQGHLHYFHMRVIDDLPYITCPAMVENICAPGMRDNFPEVYTILDIEPQGATVKCYSRDHCFAGIEL